MNELGKYIAPAQAVSSEAEAPPGKSWLISGRFTRVNQGSRFLRGALGFGSGGTKMDVTATVSDLSGKAPKRFLMIQTSGGSNAMPGAVVGVFAWPATFTGAHGLIAGLSSDCRRTSREITSALAQYMKRHGLQVADDVPKPKPRGSLPWLPQRRDAGLVFRPRAALLRFWGLAPMFPACVASTILATRTRCRRSIHFPWTSFGARSRSSVLSAQKRLSPGLSLLQSLSSSASIPRGI